MGRGHRFSHIHSSFSSCGPPVRARARASLGRVRERKLHLHPGSQLEERKPKQRCGYTGQRYTNRCLFGLRRPAFCSPRSARCGSRGDEGTGSPRPRCIPTARSLGPPASRPATSPRPLTPSPGRLPPAEGDLGRRPERDGAAALGSQSKAEARTLFLKTLDSSRVCQVSSSSRKASFRGNPLCGSPRLVSVKPSPSSSFQILRAPGVVGSAG